jgi:hypothetical protein
MRSLSADFPDLLEDGFLDLADPHAGQPIDLTDTLQSMRSVLRRNVDTIVSLFELDPVWAPSSLAIHTRFGLNGETRRPIDDAVTRVCGLDNLQAFLAFLHGAVHRMVRM